MIRFSSSRRRFIRRILLHELAPDGEVENGLPEVFDLIGAGGQCGKGIDGKTRVGTKRRGVDVGCDQTGKASFGQPVAGVLPRGAGFLKQSYRWEDIRVLKYERLRNLAMLVLVTAYFASVYLGKRAKLAILIRHIERAAKRIYGVPELRFYAIADGIKQLLFGRAAGIGPPRRDPRSHLLLLFSRTSRKMGKVQIHVNL